MGRRGGGGEGGGGEGGGWVRAGGDRTRARTAATEMAVGAAAAKACSQGGGGEPGSVGSSLANPESDEALWVNRVAPG